MSTITQRNAGGFSDREAIGDGIGFRMPFVDPTRYIVFFDDFHTYTAGDWTITTVEAGVGDATEALTDGAGGLLLITNDAADDDADFFQKTGEGFLLTSGKKCWFEARFKVSDATQSDVVIGLQITDTTPLAVTDGVYFLKSDGAATADFYVTKNSSSTTSAQVDTLVNDTFVKWGFYYDGNQAIEVWVDGVLVDTVATTTLPNDEVLTVSFGIQNGEASAKTMTVDYILAVAER